MVGKRKFHYEYKAEWKGKLKSWSGSFWADGTSVNAKQEIHNYIGDGWFMTEKDAKKFILFQKNFLRGENWGVFPKNRWLKFESKVTRRRILS